MSTRIELYENHVFRKHWDEVMETVGALETPLEATSDQLQNFARLEKAIAHINKLLLALDKELVPPSLWQNCEAPAANLLAEIKSNDAQPNAQQVDNANVQADSLIQFLSPYALTTGKAADAVGASLAAYAKVIKEHTESLENMTSVTLQNARGVEANLETLVVSADAVEAKIQAYEETLFDGTEDEAGIKAKIDDLQTEITAARDAVIKYRTELLGESEEKKDGSILHAIEQAKSRVERQASQADAALSEMQDQLKELQATYDQVMGHETEDGTAVIGLRDEYDKMLASLKEYDEDQTIRHRALEKDIKTLLPGAMSAGLASAFADQRTIYADPIKNFGRLFYLAVFLLFLVGGTTLFKVVDGQWVMAQAEDLNTLVFGAIQRLPIVLPLVWLAYFAAKRRNENRRLEEEYAHKETFARSYQSFKHQVEQLNDDESKKLADQLLSAAIEAVSANASRALDKDHDDRMPGLGQLNELGRVLPKTKN